VWNRRGRVMSVAVCALTLFLAYANGANDNFKGVATLYGSGTASYRTAITLATLATFAGSIASGFIAAGLMKTFSGNGVVTAEVAASPLFLFSVAAAAGATVMLATGVGLPISTTHALTGAIIGTGYAAVGSALNLGVIGSSFFAPLLVSPLLAICLAAPIYRVGCGLSARIGARDETCVCIEAGQLVPAGQLSPAVPAANYATAAAHSGYLTVASPQDCAEKYGDRMLGVRMQGLIDATHFLSGAAVSFARGLNDTPKIVALLLAFPALDIRVDVAVIAGAMAVGGLLNAAKVAYTMSNRISRMKDSHGQALTANLVTAFLVIFASRWGLPVSTTHVSVGAITGVGLVNGTADTRMISGIVVSWALTLPVAAAIGVVVYTIFSGSL
jgi:PiT family inorganic phosphate transporter